MRPALALPWLLTLVSVGIAVTLWTSGAGSPSADASRARRSDGAACRTALAHANVENQALREELDRLLARVRTSEGTALESASPPAPSIGDGDGGDSATQERSAELAAKYRDGLMHAISGDESAGEAAYTAILALRRQGAAGFAALRDVYRETADPTARIAMQRMLMAIPGGEMRDFVASELERESDPEVRSALLEKASRLASPGSSSLFREPLLRALGSETNPESRAAAVRGLRWIRDDSEVDGVLLSAAADPSEDVRLAAIEALAGRGATREHLREILAAESSLTVRQIGECRLLLTEPAASP